MTGACHRRTAGPHVGVAQATDRPRPGQRSRTGTDAGQTQRGDGDLEKNRDNLAKALPGLEKFQTTQRDHRQRSLLQAYVPNLIYRPAPTAVLRLRLRLPTGDQRRSATGQCRPSRSVPFPYNGIPQARMSSGVRHRHDSKPAPETRRSRRCSRCTRRRRGRRRAADLLQAQTITAYFTKTVAIYPGDEVRIAGVKVGTIESIEPIGTQAKVTLR